MRYGIRLVNPREEPPVRHTIPLDPTIEPEADYARHYATPSNAWRLATFLVEIRGWTIERQDEDATVVQCPINPEHKVYLVPDGTRSYVIVIVLGVHAVAEVERIRALRLARDDWPDDILAR